MRSIHFYIYEDFFIVNKHTLIIKLFVTRMCNDCIIILDIEKYGWSNMECMLLEE